MQLNFGQERNLPAVFVCYVIQRLKVKHIYLLVVRFSIRLRHGLLTVYFFLEITCFDSCKEDRGWDVYSCSHSYFADFAILTFNAPSLISKKFKRMIVQHRPKNRNPAHLLGKRITITDELYSNNKCKNLSLDKYNHTWLVSG